MLSGLKQSASLEHCPDSMQTPCEQNFEFPQSADDVQVWLSTNFPGRVHISWLPASLKTRALHPPQKSFVHCVNSMPQKFAAYAHGVTKQGTPWVPSEQVGPHSRPHSFSWLQTSGPVHSITGYMLLGLRQSHSVSQAPMAKHWPAAQYLSWPQSLFVLQEVCLPLPPLLLFWASPRSVEADAIVGIQESRRNAVMLVLMVGEAISLPIVQ